METKWRGIIVRQEFIRFKEAKKIVKKLEKEDVFIEEDELQEKEMV